ncbi:MAG TPA: type VI secretion protein IcmF/TssM N-terminal domain-containing protein [Thermoanaerobaculia bacterium]
MSAAWWPYALALVLLVALAVLILLVLLLRRSAKMSQYPEPGDPPAEDLHEEEEAEAPAEDLGLVAPLALAFHRAKKLLNRSAGGDRYAVPFFMLLGTDKSRDNDLLGTCGGDLPFGGPADLGMSLGKGRGFWFFDRGVIFDAAGDHILRADGRTSDESGWRSVLHQLQKLRPKRPVDGVILTIPAAELLESATNEQARSDLASRYGRVYRKLTGVQQRLGFRLPIYLVVTGCEALTGFESLCDSLTPSARKEIVGWSSPYNIDASWRGEWIDEAFAALSSRLADLQLEVFTNGARKPDDLLRLPAAVSSMRAALRTIADHLFRASAYAEPMIVRGVYLTGRHETETAFLLDLIEAKVFPEWGVGSPPNRILHARNRSIRYVQMATVALAVILGSGLLYAKYRLDQEKAVLKPFLESTVRHMQAGRQSHDGMSDAVLQRAALELLTGMAAIDFGRFASPFVPSSWLGGFEGRIDEATAQAFNEIILKAIRLELEEETRTAIASAEPMQLVPANQGIIVALPPVTSIAEMEEFRSLQQLVAKLRAIEQYGASFNQLSARGDLKDLAKLVEYSFGQQLPDHFFQKGHLYQRALRNAQYAPFDPTRFRPAAGARAEALGRAFFASLYGRSPFGARLQQLATDLQQVQWQSDAAARPDTYVNLVRRMKDVETTLALPDVEWAFRPSFNLGQAFNSVLHDIDRSAFLGPELANAMRTVGAAGLTEYQRALASTGAPVTGPILNVADGRPQMQLSPDTLLLKSALETFLGQGFVGAEDAGATGYRQIRPDVPPGHRLGWDPMRLEQAHAVAKAYDRFKDRTLNLFPPDLQISIDQVARQRAQNRMVTLLAEAQQYNPVRPAANPEQELRNDIGAFVASVQPLGNELDTFTRLRFTGHHNAAAAMTDEAYRLLLGVDQLLAQEQPYRPRLGNFSWWNGGGSPSPAAWGVGDPAEVAAYLDTTRARVTLLARSYAQPVLSWILKGDTTGRPEVQALAAKWQGILDDLRDYEAKKPGNAVAVLEDYVAASMPKVAMSSCSSAALPQSYRAHAGFYASTLQTLSSQLSNRCYALASRNVVKTYDDLARYFNQRLAGRYPFSTEPPLSNEAEADPDDVRAFFRQYDETRKLLLAIPRDSDLGATLAPARDFVTQMDGVRAFFATFLDAPKPERTPAFDVEPTFRVLREREIDGNQIIGWALRVGTETLTNRDKAAKLRWTPGEPVRLTMRWATNAPRVPVVPPGTGRGVSVRDRALVYEYTNRWALITALADNRATLAELPQHDDIDPVTLSFDVFTQAAEGGPIDDTPARVFVRLALLAPGTTQSVEVPARFPTRAPRIDNQVAEDTP